MAIIAVASGLPIGLALAIVQTSEDISATSANTGQAVAESSMTRILEMHGEEALIESRLGGLESLHNGFSTAPDFLRSELEKPGIFPPEGATTKQLQDLMADAGLTMEEMHQ